jgi:CheY-like chemotaxis protein
VIRVSGIRSPFRCRHYIARARARAALDHKLLQIATHGWRRNDLAFERPARARLGRFLGHLGIVERQEQDSSEPSIRLGPIPRDPDSDQTTAMSQNTTPVRVFLADDSALIRERVAAMLGARAMAIVGHAETPQGSIDGILAARPDVVVLDVQLEGGSGLQVLRAVRQAAPGIAFVVFSNNSGPAYRKRYLGEGAQRFLDKSTEFDQLVPAVEVASQHTH